MGRPRKGDKYTAKHFGRSIAILGYYAKFRAEDLKHSSSIAETVEVVKNIGGAVPVSETVVRRALAEFRGRNARRSVIVSISVLSGDEAARIREFHRANLIYTGLKLPNEVPDQSVSEPLIKFAFKFGERVFYPRSNRQSSS
jgi:hypothetical protein